MLQMVLKEALERTSIVGPPVAQGTGTIPVAGEVGMGAASPAEPC